jgi:hypothetical protein
MERLEERTLMSVTPGMMLQGPTPPSAPDPANPGNQLPLDMLYGTDNKGNLVPQTDGSGFVTGIYQVPGTNGLVPPPQNVNLPFKTNGSPSFSQADQSSDWWSNLMFRTDPTTVGGVTYTYSNQTLFSEPAVLNFTNNQFNKATGDWVQGLSVFSPSTIGIIPGPQGPSATTNRGYTVFPVTPLTLGIGSGKRDTGIAPVDDPSQSNPNGPDQARLRLRVNHYSDWGVQVTYGDGDPDSPTPRPPRTTR